MQHAARLVAKRVPLTTSPFRPPNAAELGKKIFTRQPYVREPDQLSQTFPTCLDDNLNGATTSTADVFWLTDCGERIELW